MDKSISVLKSILKAAGVNISGCFDKESLVDLYLRHIETSSSSESSDSRPSTGTGAGTVPVAAASAGSEVSGGLLILEKETGDLSTSLPEADGRAFCWLWLFLLCASNHHFKKHAPFKNIPKGHEWNDYLISSNSSPMKMEIIGKLRDLFVFQSENL